MAKFKKGDIVIPSGKGYRNTYGKFAGKKCEVLWDAPDHAGDIHIVNVETSQSAYFQESDLTMADKEVKQPECEYKVGDKVRIVDTGAVYDTYDDWAESHGLTLYTNGFNPSVGAIGEVKAIDWHPYNHTIIIGVRLEDIYVDRDIMIGLHGIEAAVYKPRVGDTVRLKSDHHGKKAGEIAQIVKLDTGYRRYAWIEGDCIYGGGCLQSIDELELVEQNVEGGEFYEPDVFKQEYSSGPECTATDNKVTTTKEGNIIMSVVNKIKDLTLTKEDRLLRKYQVVDQYNDNALTSTGKEILWDILFAEHKEAIVAKLEAVEAEEKKAKK